MRHIGRRRFVYRSLFGGPNPTQPQASGYDACGSCKGWGVSTGNVVEGLTCCELSGELSFELAGLDVGDTDFETMYRSGYELKKRRFQYALEGRPTLAREDFSVGLSPYFWRSSGISRSSALTSNRLLPRGICFLVTRRKGRFGSEEAALC